MDSSKELTSEEQASLKLNVLKATAIRQAMIEVVGEARPEIIRRARAKLVAMGVTLSDEEVEQQL